MNKFFTPPLVEEDPLADASSSNSALWLIGLLVIAAFLWHRFRQGRGTGDPFWRFSGRRKKWRRVSAKWDGAFNQGRFRGL